MLMMKFDTNDLLEGDHRNYHTTEMTWHDCSEDTINEMIEKFEWFLIGIGYSITPGNIEYTPNK